MANTERERYIELLKTHDWYYQYSDDHRVWTKYQGHYNSIRYMQKSVDPDYRIWNEIAPSDFKISI